MNFLTKFILQKQKVGARGRLVLSEMSMARAALTSPRLELRNPGHGIGALLPRL